jgi:hypothetical protein
MAAQSPEPYFEPVSEGVCEVLHCSSPAKYRLSWAQGVIVRLVCPTHKTQLEGNVLAELVATFGIRRSAK